MDLPRFRRNLESGLAGYFERLRTYASERLPLAGESANRGDPIPARVGLAGRDLAAKTLSREDSSDAWMTCRVCGRNRHPGTSQIGIGAQRSLWLVCTRTSCSRIYLRPPGDEVSSGVVPQLPLDLCRNTQVSEFIFRRISNGDRFTYPTRSID